MCVCSLCLPLLPELLFLALRQPRSLSTGGAAVRSEGVTAPEYSYTTLAVSQPRQWVVEVRLNRPDKRNAMNQAFWKYVQFVIAIIYCIQ